jgi:hypothetical protein
MLGKRVAEKRPKNKNQRFAGEENLTLSISGGAQRRPLHAVVRCRTIQRFHTSDLPRIH